MDSADHQHILLRFDLSAPRIASSMRFSSSPKVSDLFGNHGVRSIRFPYGISTTPYRTGDRQALYAEFWKPFSRKHISLSVHVWRMIVETSSIGRSCNKRAGRRTDQQRDPQRFKGGIMTKKYASILLTLICV